MNSFYHITRSFFGLQKKVDVEAQDAKGSTAVYWAASRGQTQMVLYLVKEANANPSTANMYRSPIHVAAGSVQVLCIVLKYLFTYLILDKVTDLYVYY